MSGLNFSHWVALGQFVKCSVPIVKNFGLGSNIGHGLFVGWVEHPDIFCWVSFLYPTYSTAVFVISAKPNKMAEDRTIAMISDSQFQLTSSGSPFSEWIPALT